MIWLIIGLAITICGLGITTIIIIHQKNKIDTIDQQWARRQADLANKNAQLEEKYQIDKKFYQDQLAAWTANQQNAEGALSSRYTALTENVAAAELNLEQINEQIQFKTEEYNQLVQTTTDEYNQLVQNKNDEYNQLVQTTTDKYEKLVQTKNDEYNQLMQTTTDEYNKLVQTKTAELNTVNEQAQKKMTELNDQLNQRTSEYNELAAKTKEMADTYNSSCEQNIAAVKRIEELKLEIEQLTNELRRKSDDYRMVLLKDYKNDQNWFDFKLSDKEQKLIEIIDEINKLYPDYKVEFAKIEWKEIWMPKFQDAGKNDGVAGPGIYRLVLKEDEKVCYVGQATNIKDRWYQHAKKMLGVDAKGNEKLYKYQPQDFYWTILVTGKEDLDNREHYWIQYYACKEVGLNKKA